MTKRGIARENLNHDTRGRRHQRENTQREGLTKRGIPRGNLNQAPEGEYTKRGTDKERDSERKP
jgi:hypothetical protein